MYVSDQGVYFMERYKEKLSICLVLLSVIQLLIIAGAAQGAVPAARFTLGRYIYEQNANTYSMDAAPFAENGRTYVPVAYLAESLNVYINWNEDTQTITLTQYRFNPNNQSPEVVYMDLRIDSIYSDWGMVEGSTKTRNQKVMDVPPVIRNGRTFLPALYVAEVFGFEVRWDSQSRSVELWPKNEGGFTTYHSAINGFSVKIPAGWNNKYAVVDKANITTFYQKRAYDASGGEMGRLFSVSVFTGEEWQRQGEEIKSITSNLGVVYGEAQVFYLSGPTDVQFDYNNNESANEYRAMENDIPSIVASFRMDLGL